MESSGRSLLASGGPGREAAIVASGSSLINHPNPVRAESVEPSIGQSFTEIAESGQWSPVSRRPGAALDATVATKTGSESSHADVTKTADVYAAAVGCFQSHLSILETVLGCRETDAIRDFLGARVRDSQDIDDRLRKSANILLKKGLMKNLDARFRGNRSQRDELEARRMVGNKTEMFIWSVPVIWVPFQESGAIMFQFTDLPD